MLARIAAGRCAGDSIKVPQVVGAFYRTGPASSKNKLHLDWQVKSPQVKFMGLGNTREAVIEKAADVRIETYTLTGRKMETLLNEYQVAGAHQLNYTAGDLPTGIYLVRLYIDQKPYTIKMIKAN